MELSKLYEPFPPEAVSWRVGSTTSDKTKGLALAYIDARDVMRRLDEVCGPNYWQDRYEFHGSRTICYLSIAAFAKVTKTEKVGELDRIADCDLVWITKADGAGDSDVEAEKGSISDAFKRAAVKWGVGRYLYDLESPWVELETYKDGRGETRVKGIKKSEFARLEGILRGKAATPHQEPKPAAKQDNAAPRQPLGLTPPRNAPESEMACFDVVVKAIANHKTYGEFKDWWVKYQPTAKEVFAKDYYEATIVSAVSGRLTALKEAA